MAGYTAIMAAAKAVLDAVTNVVNTFNHIPYYDELADLKTNFVDSGVFHTYWMTRTAVTQTGLSGAVTSRHHTFQILGFYNVDESNNSEATFQSLLDDIMDGFDTQSNLQLDSGIAATPIEMTEFIQVEVSGILCHRATLQFDLVEEVDN